MNIYSIFNIIFMKRIYDFNWLTFHVLLRKKTIEEEQFQNCIVRFKKIMEQNSIPYSRSYIKCPFCNGNKNFHRIHKVEENDDLSKLYVTVGNKKKRLGNEMVAFSGKGKLYFICDMYYHIMDDHEYVPRKWFLQLLLDSSNLTT